MDEKLIIGVEIWRKNFGNATIIFLSEFLDMFKSYIAHFAKIFLTSDQILYLINLVDPTCTKTLTFLEYLVFFENFWLVPSKRMRLFKSKFEEFLPQPYISPITLIFTICNTFLKTNKTVSFDLINDQIRTIGNDPFKNDLALSELKNEIQLSFVLGLTGIIVRDRGRSIYRTSIRIQNEKFLLDRDMMINIGKKTFIRVKDLHPRKLCDGNDKKHRVLNTNHISFDEELQEFYKIQKKESFIIKDIKSLREMTIKNEELSSLGKKFIELEIFEDGKEAKQIKLIPDFDKNDFFIGRGNSNENDIKLEDMYVSKKHCKICFDNKCGWIICEVK